MRSADQSAPEIHVMTRSPRSVVAVSGDPERQELLDALLMDAHDYDIVFVESIERGYSRIRQVTPDLIIVFLEIEDVAACQLLSMLKIDGDTSDIPVVTWATTREDGEFGEFIAAVNRDSSPQIIAARMN